MFHTCVEQQRSPAERLETYLLTRQIGNFPISSIGCQRKVTIGFTNFPNFSCQKGDKKQVPHWGLTVLGWAVNLTVIGCFLLGVCEPIHIFVYEKKDSNKCYCKYETQPKPERISVLTLTLFMSVIKTYQFMPYGAEATVCTEINTKHVNTVWAECWNVDC